MFSFDTILTALQALCGHAPTGETLWSEAQKGMGPAFLKAHADSLLGPLSGKRASRIMVTMPSEAASSRQLLEDLLKSGMNVMRINCAHDDPEA